MCAANSVEKFNSSIWMVNGGSVMLPLLPDAATGRGNIWQDTKIRLPPS